MDSNTLFRGNSLATKVVDELIKKISMSYLQRTLQSIIDEVIINEVVVDKVINEATYYPRDIICEENKNNTSLSNIQH